VSAAAATVTLSATFVHNIKKL